MRWSVRKRVTQRAEVNHRMSKKKIYLVDPTGAWRSRVAEFLRDSGIRVSIADSPEEADTVIDWPNEKSASEPTRLHSGGRITCPKAFAAAHQLGISRGDIGRLLNLLKIKITACQLGCFK